MSKLIGGTKQSECETCGEWYMPAVEVHNCNPKLITEIDHLKGEVARLQRKLDGELNIFLDEGCQYKCLVVDRLKGEVERETKRADEADALYCELRDQREADIYALRNRIADLTERLAKYENV
jgi:hypothetical protein